jgi:hypothetical protein
MHRHAVTRAALAMIVAIVATLAACNGSSSPKPKPTPSPSPDPSPNPNPSPSATPNPSPNPSPSPNPAPNPSPSPNPAPNPSPSPNPTPTPNPSPSPPPSPNPSPSPSPSPSPIQSQVALPGRLVVPATVRSSSELTARLIITNRGSTAMSFTQGALELAVLALEVRDAANARVPTIPPPVPRADDATTVTLAPGASLSRDYAMGVFSPPLAPGRYVMTCRVVACAPVPFVVAP